MPEYVFVDAVKEAEKARIALAGPAGSGKTWSALAIAQAFGGTLGVIDTEKGSARKYASDFPPFKHLPVYSYDPRELPKMLAAAAGIGLETVILDSISHFWEGTDGMLQQVDRITQRSQSRNSFAAWKEMRPFEQEMFDALLTYPGHVIVTMRTKTEYVITEDDNGRKAPQKIGLKPIQRDGIEYEFDLVGDLDQSNTLVVSKTRISPLHGAVIPKPGIPLGTTVRDWLMDGEKLPTVRDYIELLDAATTADEVREIYREVNGRHMLAAPCVNSAGEPSTLHDRIVERGNILGQRPVAEQPAPPPGVARSKGQQGDDEWTKPADAVPPAAPAPEQPPAAPAAAPAKPWTRDQAEQLIVDLLSEIGSAVTEEELGQLASRAEDAYKAQKITKRERDELEQQYVGRMTEIRGAVGASV